MDCFMCGQSEELAKAPFLRENITLASMLLKRILSEEDVAIAVTCVNCAVTFLEYVELNQRLANIENVFSAKSAPVEDNKLPPVQDEHVGAQIFCTDNAVEYEEAVEVQTEEDPDHKLVNEMHSTEPGFFIHLDHDGHNLDGADLLIEDHVEVGHENLLEGAETLELPDNQQEEHETVVSLKNFTATPRGSYKCNHCPYLLTSKANSEKAVTMGGHLQETHFISVHICSICGEEFSDTDELSGHQAESHKSMGAVKIFTCASCSLSFPTSKEFSNHAVQCPNSSVLGFTNNWMCAFCKKTFNSNAKVQDHLHQHNNDRPFKCEICSADFNSKYIYNSHMKIHNERVKACECTDCGKSFMTQSHLKKHQKTHLEERLECQVCQKLFKGQRSLQLHELVHSENKAFACPFPSCEKSFKRKPELEDHKRVHTGEKPFGCDVCGAAFAQKSNLTTHKRTTHLNEEKFQCETCNKTFKRRRLLDCHITAKHLNERPFQCELCPQNYRYPENLKQHVQNAHSDGSYSKQCEVCDKSFHTNDARNMHQYTHSDKKLYECAVCNKGFMRRSQIMAHVQQANHAAEAILVNKLRVEVKDELRELVIESFLVSVDQFKMQEQEKIEMREEVEREEQVGV